MHLILKAFTAALEECLGFQQCTNNIKYSLVQLYHFYLTPASGTYSIINPVTVCLLFSHK